MGAQAGKPVKKLAASEDVEVVAEYNDEKKSAYRGNRGDGLVRAEDHAEQIAAEHGSCYLVVQHSDRLARGDGPCARRGGSPKTIT